MRYPVWFVRFLFAAWMIPAGLNHFIPLFPQPMGSQPLSQELIRARLIAYENPLYQVLSLDKFATANLVGGGPAGPRGGAPQTLGQILQQMEHPK